MEPPQKEIYKIIYEDKIKEIEVKYEDIKDKKIKDFLIENGIFEEFNISPNLVEIKNTDEKDVLNENV